MARANTKQIGAGLAAAAAAAGAAAAGYYFYASEDAKEHRRLAAKWARDLKNDVVRQAKKAGDIDRAQLMKIIDGAVASYETVRSIDRSELKRATRELKSNWERLASEVTRGARKTTRRGTMKAKRATRTAKKRVRKAR